MHANHPSLPDLPRPRYKLPRNGDELAPGPPSSLCCENVDDLVRKQQSLVAASRAPSSNGLLPPPVAQVDVRVGVLTVSDRASSGVYADESGPLIGQVLEEFAQSDLGRCWRLHVGARQVVADDRAAIEGVLRRWSSCDSTLNLILSTGGTGLSARDVTPEAALAVLDYELPGVVEWQLKSCSRSNPLAALSRMVAGVVGGRCLLVTLPGRPLAVREHLTTLCPLLSHALCQLGS